MVKEKVSDEKIINMHRKGMTDKEMAGKASVAYARMAARRKRLGLKPNTKPSAKPLNVSKEIVAYFAGIIDGEGTVGIRKSRMKQREKQYLQWQERVTVKNTNRDVVQEFNQIFGGSFYFDQDIWVAELTNRKAAICLLTVKPYLRIKRDQCDLALKLRESKDSPEAHMRGGPSGRELRKEVIREREELFREVKELNQGGEIN